ncbi:hypothetical protein J7M28_03580 [bacterium]|nr:hypothetical protein [bacterium]
MAASRKFRERVFYFSTFVLLVSGAIFHLWQGYRVMKLKWGIAAQKEEYERLSRENDELKLEHLGLTNLSVVEAAGLEHGFIRAEPADLVVISKNQFDEGTVN